MIAICEEQSMEDLQVGGPKFLEKGTEVVLQYTNRIDESWFDCECYHCKRLQ